MIATYLAILAQTDGVTNIAINRHTDWDRVIARQRKQPASGRLIVGYYNTQEAKSEKGTRAGSHWMGILLVLNKDKNTVQWALTVNSMPSGGGTIVPLNLQRAVYTRVQFLTSNTQADDNRCAL